MISEKKGENVSIDWKILRMTAPTVLSNISVPLLGLCDTAVAGHMNGERYLAGIAIGSVMITTMYWLFSFLRAGTSGITATFFGADNREGMGRSLCNSVALAVLIGLFILACSSPTVGLLSKIMGASREVTALSELYFRICIMGCIPMMVLTALTGWMIGMQSTSAAMSINIGMSILNVISTLTMVYGLGLGFEGIAYGTLTAQWMILIPAFWITVNLCRKHGVAVRAYGRFLVSAQDSRKMFNVNSNLFFRSACLIALSMMLYAYSARLGDVEVSSNAVINQLFLFFSYFMDGFAFTGEALIGRYSGASDGLMMQKSINGLLKWTVFITLFFSIVYLFALPNIVRLLSESEAVVTSVEDCRLWVALLPVAGAAAFIYDGFYIGLTKTKPMLISTLCGVGLFAILIHSLNHTQWMLWMAFTCYLALRSLILVTLFPKMPE